MSERKIMKPAFFMLTKTALQLRFRLPSRPKRKRRKGGLGPGGSHST